MRARTGQLIRTRAGYSARYRTPEGARVQTPLGTDSKALARVRMARLLQDGTSPTTPETFGQAVARLATGDRLARLRDYTLPTMADLPVTAIRKVHVREALQAAVDAGRALNTCRNLRVDLSRILHALDQEEVPLRDKDAAKVDIPKGAKKDARRRLVLTDAEFEQFMTATMAAGDHELAAMAMCSRCIGGMRTSDLLAWHWADIDLETWASARIPRPKTKGETRLALPEVVLEALLWWWDTRGAPRTALCSRASTGPERGRSGKASIPSRSDSARP